MQIELDYYNKEIYNYTSAKEVLWVQSYPVH